MNPSLSISVTCPVCPFFEREKSDRLTLSCEFSKFRFPDKVFRRNFVFRFCANDTGYKNCPLFKCGLEFYERKFNCDFDK